MIIGLCGGSGSGKGEACSAFLELGIPSIDTDRVYHELTSAMSDCLIEIKDAFGESVISNGALDRRELSRIVFAEGAEDKRILLNTIAHKHILSATRDIAAELFKKGYAHVIIDAPLLFESGFDKECDLIIGVIADREIRISRIMRRDGIDYDSALRRINAQLSDSELKKKCNYIIENNRDIAALRLTVSKIKDEVLGG